MKKQIFIGLITFTAFGLLACNAEKPENWVAKVNSRYISQDTVNTRIATFPENVRASLKDKANQKAVINQLVNEELLYLEAVKSGLEKNSDYLAKSKAINSQAELAKKQALINLLLSEKVDSKVSITQEELAEIYKNNPDQFTKFEQRRARHILVKTEKEAQAIKRQLNTGKDFALLAQEKSIDPTKSRGGDLGWFRKGDLVPEFEATVFNLRKGKVSGVVKTQFGYHIIKLDDINTVPQRSFDTVKGQLQQGLYNQKRNNSLSKYIEELKPGYSINMPSSEPTTAQVDSGETSKSVQ